MPRGMFSLGNKPKKFHNNITWTFFIRLVSLASYILNNEFIIEKLGSANYLALRRILFKHFFIFNVCCYGMCLLLIRPKAGDLELLREPNY